MTKTEIRKMRESMGLGRVAFGNLVNASRETVRSWENGYRVPNSENMAKLEKLKEEQGK